MVVYEVAELIVIFAMAGSHLLIVRLPVFIHLDVMQIIIGLLLVQVIFRSSLVFQQPCNFSKHVEHFTADLHTFFSVGLFL